MKYLIILLLIVNIFMGIKVYDELTMKIDPDWCVCGFSSEIQYQNFKRLHIYHGCLCSWVEDGTCVFIRDGEICSLYDPYVRTDR